MSNIIFCRHILANRLAFLFDQSRQHFIIRLLLLTLLFSGHTASLYHISTVQKLHDIPILHHVFLPFRAKRPLFARLAPGLPRGALAKWGAGFEQLVPGYNFGTNEFVAEVGMNCGASIARGRTALYSPRPCFIWSRCKE